MKVDININRGLRRVFRQYETEKLLQVLGQQLSPWRKEQLAMDERRLFELQQRDNETENRKDKKLVYAKGAGRAGVFNVRDKGSVEEKLRKAYGGKVTQRVMKAERRAGREKPDDVRISVYVTKDDETTKQALTRGVDFVIVPRPHGEPTLVLHDDAAVFEIEYADDFPHSLI